MQTSGDRVGVIMVVVLMFKGVDRADVVPNTCVCFLLGKGNRYHVHLGQVVPQPKGHFGWPVKHKV